jgi:hypothetical protein
MDKVYNDFKDSTLNILNKFYVGIVQVFNVIFIKRIK